MCWGEMEEVDTCWMTLTATRKVGRKDTSRIQTQKVRVPEVRIITNHLRTILHCRSDKQDVSKVYTCVDQVFYDGLIVGELILRI